MSALAITSLVVGSLIAAANVPGLLSPEKTAAWLKAFPRHKQIGFGLMLLNAIWAGAIVFTGQYGDFWIFPEQAIRTSVFVLTPIFFILVVRYADQYLAARGLGILLILAARPMLAAAFTEETPWRLVITVLAYLWVVAGMVFVAAPHRLRDLIAWHTRNLLWMQWASAARLLFGLVLIFLALAVY